MGDEISYPGVYVFEAFGGESEEPYSGVWVDTAPRAQGVEPAGPPEACWHGLVQRDADVGAPLPRGLGQPQDLEPLQRAAAAAALAAQQAAEAAELAAEVVSDASAGTPTLDLLGVNLSWIGVLEGIATATETAAGKAAAAVDAALEAELVLSAQCGPSAESLYAVVESPIRTPMKAVPVQR